MSPERSAEVMRLYLEEAVGKGNLDVIDTFTADDFIDLFQNYHELRQAVLRITRQDHDSLLFEKAEEAVREIEEAEQARIAEQERKLSEHEVSA